MDVEKENFNTVYLCDYPIFSLCQAPNSPSSLYFAEGNELKLFDERMGKVPTTWSLHDHRINSIDFRPENPYIFATSSTDRTVCIWDIRRMKKKGSESLKVLEYNKSIQSAYFSPSGNMLATTRCSFFLTIYMCYFGWQYYDSFLSLCKKDQPVWFNNEVMNMYLQLSQYTMAKSICHISSAHVVLFA
jgi:WD40 repeat protein